MYERLQEEHFVDGNDQSIKQMMKEAWNKNSQANQSYWAEGTKDLRFKVGDQNIWNEFYTDYPILQRKKFNFNRIRRIISMVSGHQRRHRKSTTVFPIEGSDELTAEQFTKVIEWSYNSQNVYETMSSAFEGAITTGMSLISTWVDYRTDPINGEIKYDNLSYNRYMIDTFFTKKDLSDCNFVWTRKYLSKEQAISLNPKREKDIKMMKGGRRDEIFTFQPEDINPQNPNLLSYDEFWYLDYRTMTLLIDSQSGETMEWSGDNKSLKEFLSQFPQVRAQKTQKQTVKLATVLNGQVMYDGPNPYGIDKYPYVPVFCYFEPDVPYYEWKIQGIVRQLRDAQFLYNRRKIIELDILESQINSGMKIMEGSLVDDNDAFMTGQGRGLFIKANAPLGMESAQRIEPPQVPPSMIQLSQMLSEEINQISGVNEELLGSADDDKAGILSMLRQGAGLTTLETMFDNLDLSQKLLGNLTIDFIQANMSPGKIRRIINQEPTEQFFNKAFQKYDSVVGEGMLTDTQRKASFITMLEMVKLGIIDPQNPAILEKAPIPEKSDFIESQKKIAETQQQAQEQQMQLQMAQLQSQIKLTEARATADQGLGMERLARINENQELAVERRAKAIEDISDARLNRARTLKELDGLHIDQIRNLIDIAKTLNESAGEEASSIKQELNMGEENA